jgi:hypothetical protein
LTRLTLAATKKAVDVPSILPKAAMALLAAVTIPIAAASAQTTTTFVIDGTEGATTYSVSDNGITMTLSDPAQFDGVFAFGLDSADGNAGMGELNLSAPDNAFVTAFDLSFSGDVKVVSYVIGVQDGTAGGTFSLSLGGVATSTGNTLAVGSNDIEGTYTIGAGEVGTFDTNGSIPEEGFPSLESITVEVIPEPAIWNFLGLGGLVAFVGRRLRRARAIG